MNFDDELAQEFLLECDEHLVTIKAGLLAAKDGGSEIDEEIVNRVFRAVHSVTGGGLFGLVKICDLAQQMEGVLALIRCRKMVPTTHRILVLLHAADRLQELLKDPRGSKQADIAGIMSNLAMLFEDHQAFTVSNKASGDPGSPGRRLRALVVEDDLASRLLLQTFLSRYGECDVAANGRQAVDTFRCALEGGQRYDLVCMDITMPEMDGREAVRQIRALEQATKILRGSGAMVIMTTAITEAKEVFQCFQESCNAYLIKPIDLTRLVVQLKSYRLIQ